MKARADMVRPKEMDAMYARLIAHEPDNVTAIVWLRFGAPGETHTNEYEKFLIVEGTCTITIGAEEHDIKAGDYLSIPLHVDHHVTVTSAIPCKLSCNELLHSLFLLPFSDTPLVPWI